MQPDKQTIRDSLLRKRDALNDDKVAGDSTAIRQRLLVSDFYRRASCISCYVSVGNEVGTHDIIDHAVAEGKRVTVPLCRKGRRLVHRQIGSIGDLSPSQFGLLEPTDPDLPKVDPSAIDLILVPGLAFDRSGNRIGFGAGYYDGFLSQTTGLKIALAYDFQILDTVPAEPHDVPLDAIITDSQIYHCQRSDG